jgi:16S rRNA (uracil1498-N3)-methyltransferase
VGDQVTVLDGQGASYLCEICEQRKRGLALAVVEKQHTPPLPWTVTLFQAVPKGKIIEAVIQKATELGAARIVPILSERAVPHFEEAEKDRKQDKWQAIAIEALKQCGQTWLPQVEPPVSFAKAVRHAPFDLTAVASLQPGSRRLRHHLVEYQFKHGRLPGTIAVWIGPEGDFSAAELAMLLSAGARPITLGRLVLRVETAAIYALAMVNYELQEE